MPNYTYLIVGGGMTADAAVRGISEVDRSGSIGLLCAEGHPPYDRPPLSTKLWKGKPLESIWRQTGSQGVSLHLGRTARHLDLQNKRITDDQGTAYAYGKLLLATGGTPRRLPFGGEQIIYFRTLGDYERLRALTQGGQHFAVIGGGFIGSGDCGGPGDERQEGGDGLPRGGDRQPHVSARPGPVPERLLPAEGRRSTARAVGCRPGDARGPGSPEGSQHSGPRRAGGRGGWRRGGDRDSAEYRAGPGGEAGGGGRHPGRYLPAHQPPGDLRRRGRPTSTTRPWTGDSAWSTRITPTRWVGWQARRLP